MTEADKTAVPTEAQSPPAAPDVSAEPATGWVDWAVVAAVIAAALWYLYRKLWARRGTCGGCAKGKSGCAVQQATRRAQAQEGTEVRIDHIQRGP
ncbi:MAG: hypothetical protein PVJ47_10180 [Thiohalocapsa sp.]|jgi:hypothetical protein